MTIGMLAEPWAAILGRPTIAAHAARQKRNCDDAAKSTNRTTGASKRAAAWRAASADSPQTHRVRLGETLSSIANRYGVTTAAVSARNRLRHPDVLGVGATLVIPRPAGLPARLAQSPERLRLRSRFTYWARRNAIPSDLLQALAWHESGWDNSRISHAGAIGIGQLMPGTVEFVSSMIGRRLDPRVHDQNIRMTARYLRYLLVQTDGDINKALAGYYQGLASVRRQGMYDETSRYIANVRALRPRFA